MDTRRNLLNSNSFESKSLSLQKMREDFVLKSNLPESIVTTIKFLKFLKQIEGKCLLSFGFKLIQVPLQFEFKFDCKSNIWLFWITMFKFSKDMRNFCLKSSRFFGNFLQKLKKSKRSFKFSEIVNVHFWSLPDYFELRFCSKSKSSSLWSNFKSP